MKGLALGSAAFFSDTSTVSHAEDTGACSHEEEMRGWECTDRGRGFRGEQHGSLGIGVRGDIWMEIVGVFVCD